MWQPDKHVTYERRATFNVEADNFAQAYTDALDVVIRGDLDLIEEQIDNTPYIVDLLEEIGG